MVSVPEFNWRSIALSLSLNAPSPTPVHHRRSHAAELQHDQAPTRSHAATRPGTCPRLPHSLTYSYRATSAGVSYSNGASGFTQFNAAQISAAEAAIHLWEDVAGITLTRVQDVGSEYSDSGQFLLWNYATSSAGSQAANASGFGGATFSGGTWHHFVYLNDDRALVTAPAFDNDGFRRRGLINEIILPFAGFTVFMKRRIDRSIAAETPIHVDDILIRDIEALCDHGNLVGVQVATFECGDLALCRTQFEEQLLLVRGSADFHK